jgi:hypothetical protein
MEDINAIITNNFNDNIQYIQQHHKELFSKLSEYDAAVSNGHYKERYELVYENGNFDVFEPSTQKYLYNKKTNNHIELSLKSANKKIDNNIFEGFIRNSFNNEDIAFYRKEKNLKSHLNFSAEIINYTQKNTVIKEIAIGKYIFFGVGLGLHIAPISAKLEPSILFIIEDDLELFRLSLFCLNYANLSKSTDIIFSVFDEKESFMQSCESFLNKHFYLNHYIKHFDLLSHSHEKSELFYLALTNQPHLRFLFNDTASTYLKPLKHFFDQSNIVQNTIDISTLEIPFLLLCSGPSLQKNIKWIKNNQHNFIIVAVSSALSYLKKNEIKIDIITHLDPFDASINSFTRVNQLNYFDRALKLFSITSPDKILKLFKKNLFLFEVGTSYQKNSLKLSAPCVGSWSLLMLLALQIKEIYILGLDLALDTETGKNHIDDHQDNQNISLTPTKEDDSTLKYKESSFLTSGNFQEMVYTTPHFYSSIEIINRYFTKIKKDFQNIYNLGDGALLDIAKPRPIDTFIPTNQSKENIFHRLEKSIKNNSQSRLSSQDIEELFQKLKHAKNIKEQILSFTLQTPFNPESYMQSIIDIVANKEDLFIYEISRIYEDYMKYTAHYIYQFLTSINDQKKIQDIDNIFRYNITKLADIYIETVETIVKKDS